MSVEVKVTCLCSCKATATRAIFCLWWWCNFLFSNCCVASVRWWLHLATKFVILLQKIQLTKLLVISFCDFFRCRITFARVATHAIFAACWRRDNVWFQKISIPHPRKGFFIWPPFPSGFSKNGPQSIPPPPPEIPIFSYMPGNISISCLKRKIS